MKIAGRWFLAISVLLAGSAQAAYFEVSYPPSNAVGELPPGVTYTVWIPDGVAKLRAVIVHQHGCGTGACKGGATAAYDLHWQALARKWDAALLGPSYQQEEKQSCLSWCDPRNGSAKAFLKALADLAGKSQHPELATAPWCLWGHSGGGFWSSLMQTMYPERIVAIWFRSGTAFSVWEKETIAKPELTDAVYAIPAMCNPGAKEEGDPRFQGAWTGTLTMFQAYRAKGAPIGFAPDPLTSHQCGDCRYLAIPFFDTCLAMRLPEKNASSQALRPIDQKLAWLATMLTDKPEPAAKYRGDIEDSVWLPNEAFARAWSEYVRTGAVSDPTPPPAPGNVRLRPGDPAGTVEITWTAQADLQSGLQAFVILRDGRQVARLPEKPVIRFGRPLFQAMSYHDTPEAPIPPLRHVDPQVAAGEHVYQVIAVNSVGLQSPPSAPTKIEAKSPPGATPR